MRFNEEQHSYVNDQGEEYMSATSFIKRFAKPFDKLKIAKKYAKKHKRDVEDVLADWEKAGQDAIKKGLFFHKMQEDELLAKSCVTIEDEEHPVYPSVYDNGDKVTTTQKLEPGIYPELCVWSDKYQIAGQADYVEVTKRGKINIKDYKTSKEIKTQGWEKWDGTTDKLAFPLHNLDDCNYNHYSLQLNLYAFLIKQHNRNLKIGSLTIEHIIGEVDEKTSTFEIKSIVQYKVHDLQKEIKVALEYYKNTKEPQLNHG